jgi:FkbM family methyltransferase
MNIEQTLKGNFQSLYNEVVVADCYNLKTLSFKPDIIFDLGANIGVFTRFAHEIFPEAKIISVEPNPTNLHEFKTFTPATDNILLIQKAIGEGKIYRLAGDHIGYHESYVNAPQSIGSYEETSVDIISFNELWDLYFEEGKKVMLKIDIEGNENEIFKNPDSFKKMVKADYIVAEIHWYSNNWKDEDREIGKEYLSRFEKTHNVILGDYSFYAQKK